MKRIIITVDTDTDEADAHVAQGIVDVVNESYASDFVHAYVEHDLPTYTGTNREGEFDYLVTVLPDGKTVHVALRARGVPRWGAPTFCRRTDDTRPST